MKWMLLWNNNTLKLLIDNISQKLSFDDTTNFVICVQNYKVIIYGHKFISEK